MQNLSCFAKSPAAVRPPTNMGDAAFQASCVAGVAALNGARASDALQCFRSALTQYESSSCTLDRKATVRRLEGRGLYLLRLIGRCYADLGDPCRTS